LITALLNTKKEEEGRRKKEGVKSRWSSTLQSALLTGRLVVEELWSGGVIKQAKCWSVSTTAR